MFESAIDAAATAASTWSPECAAPVDGRGCCSLCTRRYRRLVLDGPLQQLPHAVAHAAVVRVDELITERLDRGLALLAEEARDLTTSQEGRDAELSRRARAASGALTVIALEEFAEAEHRLSELRRCFTEPALAAYLARHPVDGVPRQWES